MKKGIITVCMLLAIVTLAFAVFAIPVMAFGPAPVDNGHVKLPVTQPKKAKSSCVTITKSRAGKQSVNVSNFFSMNWKAFNADGTAATVRRSFDNLSTSAFFPSTGETGIGIERNVTNAVFQRYTGGASVTVCVEGT